MRIARRTSRPADSTPRLREQTATVSQRVARGAKERGAKERGAKRNSGLWFAAADQTHDRKGGSVRLMVVVEGKVPPATIFFLQAE